MVPGRVMEIKIEGPPGVGKTVLLQRIKNHLSFLYEFIDNEEDPHTIAAVKKE